MLKLIAQYLEARRQRRHWLYMSKLMRESGPVVVQTYPEKSE